MTATVLITRPLRQGQAFAAALEAAFGGPVQTVISPLIETAPMVVDQDFADVSHVLFTSVNGVQQAGRLQVPTTATAWCVGEKTAQAAQVAGFETRTAGGTSEKLMLLIVAANPVGRMIHVRGKHTTGDIIGHLAKARITCEPVIAYDQVAIAPTQQAIDLLCGENPVIVPLFSPRTAKLFEQIGVFRAPLHLVVMSEAVFVSTDIVPVTSCANGGIYGMVEGTLTRYRRFSP